MQNSPRQAERLRLDILEGHGIADRKLVTAFGATAGEDRTAILGRHARAEAMLVDSFTIAGLEGSFHDGNSIL